MSAVDLLKRYPGAVLGELVRVLPDGLVFMSALFSVLTLSLPQFVLFISLLESIGVFYLFRNITFLKHLPKFYSDECRSGFQTANFSTLSLFTLDNKSAFPSAPLYMTSVAAAYLFNSVSMQMKELEVLGTEYTLRFFLSVMMMCVVLFFLGSYRMYYDCESVTVVILSILAGLAVGTILIKQNNALFGPDSINLSGIPLLRNKTATGDTMYVCNVVT